MAQNQAPSQCSCSEHHLETTCDQQDSDQRKEAENVEDDFHCIISRGSNANWLAGARFRHRPAGCSPRNRHTAAQPDVCFGWKADTGVREEL